MAEISRSNATGRNETIQRDSGDLNCAHLMAETVGGGDPFVLDVIPVER